SAIEFSHNNFQLTPALRIGIRDGNSNANSYQFGYTASYLWGDLMLQSSLTHQYYLTPSSSSVQATTQFTIGVVKRLNSNPMQWLSQKVQRGRIRGRVFVDERIRGAYEAYDRGLRGIRVVLDDGKEVTTDANGEFQFSGLDARMYTVSVPLDQFPTPVRMTTPSPIRVDLTKRRTAEVPFGVINFARITGMAYNDYTMQGVRAPDAAGIAGLKLTMLEAPDRARMTECESGGDYEFSNLQPGKYVVEVDPASLPANYELPTRKFEVELQPASTFVLDVPVRAIRTISGVVLYQESASASPQPLANMIIEAGGQSAKTGPDGTFLLRHLPAGEITLRVLPPAGTDLPAGVRLPAGKVRLTREPQQVEGVKITISNPVLLNYLLRNETIASK
ncbi:MAG TPA: SdrD B-like domain-containing protein, partial [Terriglobales bacterium]